MNFPYLQTNNKEINTAYRLAIATLAANILPFQDGILTRPEPVIIAGLGYSTPWTRDAAINTWNAGALICPEISRSTLESVLTEKDGILRIGGEYWDAIIWVTGAWQLYLCTGDREFLALAYRAAVNSLAYFEATEFDAEKNLFRGPACYGDGIAAYPDVYARHGTSAIMTFAKQNRELCVDTGVGIPMFALSTNCLYYHAYVLADKMAAALGLPCSAYAEKAARLKNSVNAHFWSEEKQNYTYLCDPFGGCDHQEGLGASFALLFGIADDEKAETVLAHRDTRNSYSAGLTQFSLFCCDRLPRNCPPSPVIRIFNQHNHA